MEKPHLGFGVSFDFHLVTVVLVILLSQSEGHNDAQVMNILKKAINFRNDSWANLDFCKWEQVQCNSAKRVTRILLGCRNVQGSLPKELENLTELQRFECMKNNLTGPFPNLAPSIRILVIHTNLFSSIPSDFFRGKRMLQVFDISDNPFSQWQIPNSLKDCASLHEFRASNAGLSGTIQEAFGHFPGLVNLTLSYNSFEGGLPASFSGTSIEFLALNGQRNYSKLNGTLGVLQNMTSLKQIWLNGNSFTGPIPDFSKHNQLFEIRLKDNQLTGVVPQSLMELKSLRYLYLANNLLQGPKPKFNKDVQVDAYAKNQFCSSMTSQPCSPLVNALLLVAEHLGYPVKFAASWKGNNPCSNWIGITCSGNNISVINFPNMGLSGTISPSFASLTSVTRLILANNNLMGSIPNELTSMPLLKELDVSNNHLYGSVPSFSKNVHVKLVGNPDIGKLNPSSGSLDANIGVDGKSNIGVAVGTVVGIIVLIGLVVLGTIILHKKQKNSSKVQSLFRMVLPPNHHGHGKVKKKGVASVGAIGSQIDAFSPKSNVATDVHMLEASNMVIPIHILREVTNNFSEKNILGKGGFGTVYKGELHDGTKIAVKRMQSGVLCEKGLNEFCAEITVLTRVQHRHLVALTGYCLHENERLIVYEYMPRGTLSQHLFNWKELGLKPLEWTRRLIIALDVARGIDYLHSLAQQIFIHRDIKPSNILLGDDMRAKVSDFGLVRLAPEGKASFQTQLAGTFGYLAPEYAATGRITTKVDVYGFGVILMEMITGRKVLDDNQDEENIHLVPWFRRMQLNKDTFRTAIDPTLDVHEETFSSISTVAELAGHCTSREPHQRPDMCHAVNVLSSLIEVWKPSESADCDDMCFGVDMSLPQALRQWQGSEGSSTMNVSTPSFTTKNGC